LTSLVIGELLGHFLLSNLIVEGKFWRHVLGFAQEFDQFLPALFTPQLELVSEERN
jgi:hypothetical protein